MYVDEKVLDDKMVQVNAVFAHLVARIEALEAVKAPVKRKPAKSVDKTP